MRHLPHVVLLLIGLASLAIAVAGCGGTTDAARPGQTTVVAAFYPLAWVAEQVGGTGVHVTDLTPPGAEPHDVELTPKDVEEIRDADLVLFLGRGFQPSVEKAVESRSEPSLDLLAGQTLRHGTGGGDGQEALDPHVWLDPTRLATMATAVGRALGSPKRAAALSARLHRLDARMAAGLASCRRRQIVTSHAAFGYLARRYRLEQIALGGLTPEAEPRPRDLARLIHDVERTHATTVFFEPLVSSRIADTIAREAGVKTAELDPLEGLTSDEAAKGEDYVSIMDQNLGVLREALGCR
jgi:zinc transport system substrate-binding protein